MPEQILPEGQVEVGSIYISMGLTPEGNMSLAFDIQGLEDEAAIGYLVSITDRIRDRIRYEWEAVQFAEDSPDDDEEDDPDDL